MSGMVVDKGGITCDLEQAKSFLRMLDPSTDVFTFQTFDDKGQSCAYQPGLLHGTLEQHWDELVRRNIAGQGVFVTVNQTDFQGRRKENIVAVRAAYQEDDDGQGGTGFPISPNLVIQSSPGKFHRYWLLDKSNPAAVPEAVAVEETLVKHWGSDPAAKDVSRVLRLPGFFNRKASYGGWNMVSVVQADLAHRYTWQQIIAAFPPTQKVRAQAHARARTSLSDPFAGVPVPFNRDKLWSALSAINPDIEYPDWLSVLMALHSLSHPDGYLFAVEWSKTGSKFQGEAEIEEKWAGFTAGNGITIATLYHMAKERGWSNTIEPNGNQFQHISIEDAGGKFEENVELSVRALACNLNNEVLQRSSALVRVAHLKDDISTHGVQIPKGTATIVQLTHPDLVHKMAKSAYWEKWNAKAKRMVPCNPNNQVASIVLASVGNWGEIPSLAGIAESPIIRADGSIHDAAGYDTQSTLYHEGRAPEIVVPEFPTPQEALAALEVVNMPFAEFPFVDARLDMSVVLSYMLTMVVRAQVGLAPLHGFGATTPGSGKGLIVECCNLIVRGRDASIMPPVAGTYAEEETRKRITAVLLQGVNSVLLDNWTTPVGGDSMNTLMTSTEWSDRVLGASKTVSLSSKVTWAASGNNLAVRGDMVRRSLLCQMDPQVERPEQRTFKNQNLVAWVIQNRPVLLSALYTILRAYRQAGNPQVEGTPLGRFEPWWHAVSAPLIWLGLPDPCETQKRLRRVDPETENLTAVVEAIYGCFGTKSVTIKQMRDGIYNKPSFVPLHEPDPWEDLQEALQEIAPGVSPFDARAAGVYLKRNDGRVIGNKKLVVDSESKRIYYKIENVCGG